MKTFLLSMLGGALGVVTGVVLLIFIILLLKTIHKKRNSREYIISEIESYCKKHNKPIPSELSSRTFNNLIEINKHIRSKK